MYLRSHEQTAPNVRPQRREMEQAEELPELTEEDLQALLALPPFQECWPHWFAGEVLIGGEWVKG